MRLLIPRCIWCKAKPDYMPKKCGHWGEHVCHSMSRCSFPGINFYFLKFSFCFYPDSRFASGHLLAFWWRDIKKAVESAEVSPHSPDVSPQEAFSLHRYCIVELLSLFALPQQNLLPMPKTCLACQPKLHHQMVPPPSSSCYCTGLCMGQGVWC